MPARPGRPHLGILGSRADDARVRGHVLGVGDRALAERFSEVRPPIRGPFERLQAAESPWGPLLGGSRPRAACRLAGSTPVGYGELAEGVIEQLALPDLEDPLATCTAATDRWVTSPITAELVAPVPCLASF